jgi:hypothetical protein
MVQSYVCEEAFKRMKQSLERGDVEKFNEKWSKMYGIRKAYWKHPRRSRFARRHGLPTEGYEAVVKKRFRKKPMYDQDDMDLRLLAPFDDGTIVEGTMADELTMGNFITGPELGICMPSLSHLHESAKEPSFGQRYIEENKEMKLRMHWGRYLMPWPSHLFEEDRTEEQLRRISVHYNMYTPYHPGYLTLKKNMVEDSVETGIKSPEPEGTKRRREKETHTVAMVTTTPPPKRAGHYKERWVFDTGAMAHIMNNDRYMYNLCPMKQTITVADGTVYPVQSKGKVVLRSICGAILTLKGDL